ncbi:MAG: hypothetical protein NTZ59_08455 [Bacteroidetes bacterium]|nr:hypothetical protein [Bacteroidota bacterium]
MSHHHEETVSKDFTKNWVNSSRFVFYLSLAALVAFLVGASFRLSHETYKGKPDVEIQSSSKYTPEYK